MIVRRPLPTVAIKVLCVDSDTYLADLLQFALSHDGCAVDLAKTAAEALRSAEADPPDVAVIDLDMADIDGRALCGRLRSAVHARVIMLASTDSDADVVAAFQHGADDYVRKPFSVQVLSWRVRAVARRGECVFGGSRRVTYRLGPAVFNAERYELIAGAAHATLTPIQGKILRVLLENEGHVVSADQLMAKVWHFDSESDVSVIKTHISNLRKKLTDVFGSAEVVHTIAGVGYSVRRDVGRRDGDLW